MAAVADNCRPGQSACLAGKLISICLNAIAEPYPMLRRWVTLCLAKLWEDFDEAKWVAVRELAHQRLCVLLTDPVPEVILQFLFLKTTKKIDSYLRYERPLFMRLAHS